MVPTVSHATKVNFGNPRIQPGFFVGVLILFFINFHAD